MIGTILREAVLPALALLPGKMTSPQVVVMILAIMGQESDLKHRAQILANGTKGAARGLAQFEENGGVAGVLGHPATAAAARVLCKARHVGDSPHQVWLQLERDDVLAAGFARLLLYTDPKPLPAMGDRDIAWVYYLRTWRPGRPRALHWPSNYRRALRAVTRGIP